MIAHVAECDNDSAVEPEKKRVQFKMLDPMTLQLLVSIGNIVGKSRLRNALHRADRQKLSDSWARSESPISGDIKNRSSNTFSLKPQRSVTIQHNVNTDSHAHQKSARGRRSLSRESDYADLHNNSYSHSAANRRWVKWPPLIALILSPLAYPLCSHLRRTPFGQQAVIPDKPLFDVNASVCGSVSQANGSCCTEELERIMVNTAKRELASVYEDRIIVLHQLLNYHYELFDRQYKEAISISSKQLYAMFTRTYGPFYQSHTEIFARFFDDLQEFYSGPTYTPLKPVLDRFFFDLFRTLLLILNPMDEIKEDDFECLRSSLALQPFGDIPLKMVRQLERSLGAARSFTTALQSSADILQDVLKKELSLDCQRAVAGIMYCSLCSPISGKVSIQRSVKSCQKSCFDTLNQCFANYIVIENTWQQFIETLTKLATRLRGPYNVMAVVIPLAVQISESIMVFQEKAPTISPKVVRKCLRKDKEQPLKRDMASFGTSSAPLPDFSDSLTNAHSQFLSSFIEKIKETRGFWKIGPRLACINATWSASTSDEVCWNGTKITDNLNATDEKLADSGIGSNFTTSVFLNERLKLLMLSNRMLDSYEGRRFYNESMEAEDEESSGDGFSYASVDDEDGDDGSGSDENQPAVVVDVAGSHRDIETPVTEESDLKISSTSAPAPSDTLPRPDIEITKSCAHRKPLRCILYFIIILRVL